MAGTTFTTGECLVLRFDEVFDVERPAKELSEAFQVEVQVQGHDLALLVP